MNQSDALVKELEESLQFERDKNAAYRIRLSRANSRVEELERQVLVFSNLLVDYINSLQEAMNTSKELMENALRNLDEGV
jgi:hypothetical protein